MIIANTIASVNGIDKMLDESDIYFVSGGFESAGKWAGEARDCAEALRVRCGELVACLRGALNCRPENVQLWERLEGDAIALLRMATKRVNDCELKLI